MDIGDIDEFQYHLDRAVENKLNSLDSAYSNASENDVEDPRELEGYRNHLEDLMISAQSAKLLCYELSIVALYKKIEIKTKKIAERQIPNAKPEKLSYFNELCKTMPFITDLQHFSSFDELRLLNNAIKHGGIVSDELAREFSHWNLGEELKDLEDAYRRLLPNIQKYIHELVDEIYSRYDPVLGQP